MTYYMIHLYNLVYYMLYHILLYDILYNTTFQCPSASPALRLCWC